jgi:hypothetical protein
MIKDDFMIQNEIKKVREILISYDNDLNPGLSVKQISQFEKNNNYKLPNSISLFFQSFNGFRNQDSYNGIMFYKLKPFTHELPSLTNTNCIEILSICWEGIGFIVTFDDNGYEQGVYHYLWAKNELICPTFHEFLKIFIEDPENPFG